MATVDRTEPMSILERVELALIPIMGLAIWFLTPVLPDALAVGRLFLYGSALVLFQSLVRDLWLLSRRDGGEPVVGKAVRCICVESAVGATGVVVGCVLVGVGISRSVAMSDWSWPVLVVMILSAGFLMKDFVFEWNPWRIRRDKDHINIVFTWKK